MKGRCFLIRFADDFVVGFELEEDAHRVMEVLPKRFGRFSLTIHPEKTVLLEFKRPSSRDKSAKGKGTFDFLGFTHYWAKTTYTHQKSKLQYSNMLKQDMGMEYTKCTAIHSIGSCSLESQVNWNEDNKMQR
jgi:hypothetical protein